MHLKLKESFWIEVLVWAWKKITILAQWFVSRQYRILTIVPSKDELRTYSFLRHSMVRIIYLCTTDC